MSDSSIRFRPIIDLLTNEEGDSRHFWIPKYQRGYRWKPDQVTQLLNDIWESYLSSEGGMKEASYCLQPLVIYEDGEGRFEVVDGQQRLTTIYILLTYLKKPRFSITFETKGDSNDPFLEDIDLKRAEENIDFYHICDAYSEIENWFNARDLECKEEFHAHLLKNVKVIWFELSDKDNRIDAFTRLNVGKIPLTDDELIRALFLRKGSEPTEVPQLRALEWDQFEKALQADPFWYFLNNVKEGPRQNRIGFLFRLVVEANGWLKDKAHDDYEIFDAYNRQLKNEKASDVWLFVKQAFMQLEEWFEDRMLYHIVGFLIHQGSEPDELLKIAGGRSENTDEPSKKEFEKELRKKIFKKAISDESLGELKEAELSEKIRGRLEYLEYGKHSPEIRSLLLLFNIATLLEYKESNIRFQFDSFKRENWDIEHIRSVTDDQPQRHDVRIKWMEDSLAYLQALDSGNDLLKRIRDFVEPSQENKDDTFEELYNDVLECFQEKEEEESDHTIANLTLLDSNTNRSYKNAVYAVKRKRLLELDQSGTFVPLCTRNVFLKCYSPKATNLLFWKDEDREAYLEVIVQTLVKFFMEGGTKNA